MPHRRRFTDQVLLDRRHRLDHPRKRLSRLWKEPAAAARGERQSRKPLAFSGEHAAHEPLVSSEMVAEVPLSGLFFLISASKIQAERSD
jgi:hypothetical protein